MKEVYRRHFKITEGPIIKAAEIHLKTEDEARLQFQKILKDLGAESKYYYDRGKLIALIFDKEPDTKLYKRTRYGWYPKKNSKVAKAIAARIEGVKTSTVDSCLKHVGLSSNPTIFMSTKCYYPTLTILPYEPPVLYLSVPWYDEDPEVIKEYNADENRMSRNLDAIQWTPTQEMVEIKRWERDKAIDEWNEKVRKENGQQ